ncbi:MAG: response regulator [Gemmatimonadetes bacterium]|nr:MAG: response regulator [Gemmatimonadota bacterium]
MSKHVLFVDDEPSVLEGLKVALRKEPYTIHTANSADEAIKVLARVRVDVVVSDERMPGMSGSEFLSLVRREYPQAVRILLTGQASLEAAIRAINEGEVYRMLTKPQKPDALAATIRQALALGELRAEQKGGESTDEERAVHDNPDLGTVERAEDGSIVIDDLDVDFEALMKALEEA